MQVSVGYLQSNARSELSPLTAVGVSERAMFGVAPRTVLRAPSAALVLAMAATAGRRSAIAAALTEAGRLPPLRVTPAWIHRQTRTDALREATTLVVC